MPSHFGFVAFGTGNAFSFWLCGTRCRQCSSHFGFVVLAAGNAFSFFGVVAFGTGEGLLRYGIRIRCSKQAPGVRDAFSEAFGAKNRRFRYRRDIRYQKPPFMVRTRTRRTGNGFLWPSTQLRLPGSQVFQPGSRRFRIILIP